MTKMTNMPKRYTQMNIRLKRLLKNYAFYASGVFQTLLTGAFGILVALSLGAELRGEFALLFSYINLTIAFAYSAEKGNIIKSRVNQKYETKNQLLGIVSKRAVAGTLVPLILFIFYDTSLSLMNITVVLLSIFLNGELQLSAQKFLSKKEPLSATIANSGTWLFMLIAFSVSLKMDVAIDINYLVICLGLSSILAFCIVLGISILRSEIIRKDTAINRIQSSNINFFTLSSFGSVLQSNGLVILFGLSHDLVHIGVLSIATAILNGNLSLLSSFILGRYWLKERFSLKMYVSSVLFLLAFSFVIGLVIQILLNDEFRNLYKYLMVLIPYYISNFTTEVVINRSIHKQFFRRIVIFKFLNSMMVIPVFVVCGFLQLNFFSSLLLVSSVHFSIMFTFYLFSGIHKKLG